MQATECFVEIDFAGRTGLFVRFVAQIIYVKGRIPQTCKRFIKLEGTNVAFLF